MNIVVSRSQCHIDIHCITFNESSDFFNFITCEPIFKRVSSFRASLPYVIFVAASSLQTVNYTPLRKNILIFFLRDRRFTILNLRLTLLKLGLTLLKLGLNILKLSWICLTRLTKLERRINILNLGLAVLNPGLRIHKRGRAKYTNYVYWISSLVCWVVIYPLGVYSNNNQDPHSKSLGQSLQNT